MMRYFDSFFRIRFCVNYYILVARGHGINFMTEFNNLKKSRRIALGDRLVGCYY